MGIEHTLAFIRLLRAVRWLSDRVAVLIDSVRLCLAVEDTEWVELVELRICVATTFEIDSWCSLNENSTILSSFFDGMG